MYNPIVLSVFTHTVLACKLLRPTIQRNSHWPTLNLATIDMRSE
jgi:hypothetical protein